MSDRPFAEGVSHLEETSCAESVVDSVSDAAFSSKAMVDALSDLEHAVVPGFSVCASPDQAFQLGGASAKGVGGRAVGVEGGRTGGNEGGMTDMYPCGEHIGEK